MKRKIDQFALKLEANPGEAETLDPGGADITMRIREGFVITPNVEMIDLQETSASESKRPELPSKSTIAFDAAYVLKGPGDLVTPPAADPYLKSAVLRGYPAFTVNIGSITNGPFPAGMVVTGAPSGGVGVVIKHTADGAASLPVQMESGAFANGDTLTGTGTTPPTATAGADPAAAGHVYRPNTWAYGDGSAHHGTMKGVIHKRSWTGRGLLSTVNFEFTNAGPCIVSHAFTGALHATADENVIAKYSYPEDAVVTPKFNVAAMRFGSITPFGVTQLTLTIPNNLELKEDGNAQTSVSDGILLTDYSRERIVISMEIDQTLIASADYEGMQKAGTTDFFEWTLGNVAGAIWDFSAPAAQVRDVTTGQGEPDRATTPLEFGLNGQYNDELFIWSH